jgi:hypothetical protein
VGHSIYFVLPTSVDTNGKPIIFDLSQIQINLGFTATDGITTLFEKGKLNPGADLGIDVAWQIEPDNYDGYVTLFSRIQGKATKRALVSRNEFDSTLFTLNSEAELGLGAGGGVNWVIGEADVIILGLSFLTIRTWGSTEDLEERTVCVVDGSGRNDSGDAVSVADCSDRFFGKPSDLTATQARFDLVKQLHRFGPAGKSARLGLIGAVSRDLGEERGAWNVSLGPSLHPDRDIAQVLFATLFEVDDLFDERKKKPDFWDRFRVRVHVGVPFSFL